MSYLNLICTCVLAAVLSSCSSPKSAVSHIQDQTFNQDWLFHKGDVAQGQSAAFNDVNWRKLSLPHDWAIEGPFDNTYNARTGGLPVHGVGWYRKHFEVPTQWQGKHISVEFDGAMHNAEVWINGQFAGKRPYGYIGFEVDLTPHIQFGQENTLAVKLSPEDLAARWYPGAGIYRNVRLKVNSPVHIPQYGTYITTPNINDAQATIHLQTKVTNAGANPASVVLETQVLDQSGTKVATHNSALILPPGATLADEIDLTYKCPEPMGSQ